MNPQDDSPGRIRAGSEHSTSSVTLVEPEVSGNDGYVVDHLSAFDAGAVPAPGPVERPVEHAGYGSAGGNGYYEDDVPDVEPNADIDDWYFRALATPKGKANAIPSPETRSPYQSSPTASSSNPYTNRSLPPLPTSLDSPDGPRSTPPSGGRPHYSARPFRFPDPEDSDDEIVGRPSPTITRPLFSHLLGQPSTTYPPQQRPAGSPFPSVFGTDLDNVASSTNLSPHDVMVARHLEERESRIREQEKADAEVLKEKERAQSAWRAFGERAPQPATPTGATAGFSRSPIQNPAAYTPAHHPRTPWGTNEHSRNHPLNPNQSNQRPDIHSRNATLTTISELLFNFDCTSEEIAGLIEDACATAKEVGVPTNELLAHNVMIGNHDLGMTPLCLEASRCDLNNGVELLAWLLDNVPRGLVDRDLKRGCLMRNNGLGDQSAWSTMKLFVPEEEGQAVFAYDVAVENVYAVLGGGPTPTPAANQSKEIEQAPSQDSDDEGSLYDDISIIDAESSLNQADIETLKSSDDEGDDRNKSGPAEGAIQPPNPTVRVHRARIDIPLFEASLRTEDEYIAPAYTALPEWSPAVPSKIMREYTSGMIREHPGLRSGTKHMPMQNRVLTAEWMHEGRIWALSIGQNKLVLTLRRVSEIVEDVRVKVKALVRIFPADMEWGEVEELKEIGPHRLLPTVGEMVVPPVMPCYSCEFDEMEMVPGPPTLNGRSSVWKEGIYMSSLSLLDMIGPSGAMKVEVVVKITEVLPEIVVSEAYPSEDKAGGSGKGKLKANESVSGEFDDWQQVDF